MGLWDPKSGFAAIWPLAARLVVFEEPGRKL
jgi:hypothetical protein